MSYQHESFEESLVFDQGPTTLLSRLGYVRRLIFSRTRLEFRLLWNKIFQKEDEELGWLLNPYKRNNQTEATMLSSFNKNVDNSYQYDFDTASNVFGRERVTIYNRGIAKKGDRRRRHRNDNRSLGDKALEYARYMGMGVYMTSTSFPSPFYPANDAALYDETLYVHHSTYSMSKLW